MTYGCGALGTEWIHSVYRHYFWKRNELKEMTVSRTRPTLSECNAEMTLVVLRLRGGPTGSASIPAQAGRPFGMPVRRIRINLYMNEEVLDGEGNTKYRRGRSACVKLVIPPYNNQPTREIKVATTKLPTRKEKNRKNTG